MGWRDAVSVCFYQNSHLNHLTGEVSSISSGFGVFVDLTALLFCQNLALGPVGLRISFQAALTSFRIQVNSLIRVSPGCKQVKGRAQPAGRGADFEVR